MTPKKERILKWANQVLDEKGMEFELPSERTQRLVFLNKSKGVYSGVSQIIYHRSGNVDTYGFMLDFTNQHFQIDSASGNVLQPNSTVLKKAFPEFNPLIESDSHSAQMFGIFGMMFGSTGEEEPNMGRGLYRAMEEYTYAESFYKDIILDNQGELEPWAQEAIKSYRTYTWHGMVNKLKSVYNRFMELLVGTDKPKTSSLRKVLGLSKKQFSQAHEISHRLTSLTHHNEFQITPYRKSTLLLLSRVIPMLTSITEENHTYESLNAMLETFTSTSRYESDAFIYLDAVVEMLETDNPKFNFRRLLEYVVVDLVTRQGISDFTQALRLLKDYYNLAFDGAQGKFLGGKNFIKFPKYLKVAHDIASRNFKEIKDTASAIGVAKVYMMNAPAYEGIFKIEGKEYAVIMPRSSEEIVDEGQRQSNCVGGYSRTVAEGKTLILSMREANHPTKSWITIEINPQKQLKQAYLTFNNVVTEQEARVLGSYSTYVGVELKTQTLGVKPSVTWSNLPKATRTNISVDDYHITPKEDVQTILADSIEKEKELIEEAMTHVNRL